MRGRPWTQEETEVLEKNYGKGKECYKLLPGRSVKAIRRKAQYQMFEPQKTIEDYKRLKKEIPMRSVAFYARELGVSGWTIRRYNKIIKTENYETRRAGRTGG